MTASDLRQLSCQHLGITPEQYVSSPLPRVPLRLVTGCHSTHGNAPVLLAVGT